jgi:hypothetical protein
MNWPIGEVKNMERGMLVAFVMSELSETLKERTMSFSVNVLRLIDRLPRSIAGDVVARQLAKSAIGGRELSLSLHCSLSPGFHCQTRHRRRGSGRMRLLA